MTRLIPGRRRVWNTVARPARRFRIDRRGAIAVFLALAGSFMRVFGYETTTVTAEAGLRLPK